MLAAANDTITKVTYGHPGQNIPGRFVAVADTENGVEREQRTLPLKRTSSRTETYGLRVVVWVLLKDFDSTAQQSATEQAWTLADLLDDDLRAEPTLGGLVTWALPTRFVDDDFLLNEGRAAEIVVTVSVNVNRA
jgi:hypothetical protein